MHRGYRWSMRTLGNILWLVLAGWWLALLYLIAGIIACVLIITIPLGIASFRLANYVFWPLAAHAVPQGLRCAGRHRQHHLDPAARLGAGDCPPGRWAVAVRDDRRDP